MYKFRVPENYIEGFTILILLEENEIVKVLKTIHASEAGLQLDGFKDLLSAENLELTNPELHELSLAIYSLIQLKTETKTEVDSLVRDLIGSYFEENELEIPEGADIDVIKTTAANNLLKIFQEEGQLPKTIKGLGLLMQNDKTYINSRILTDVRLIFDSKNAGDVNGAVILHQLKIVYTQNDEEKQIFYALDNADLLELKDNIIRAIEKEEFISKSFSSNLQFIKPIR